MDVEGEAQVVLITLHSRCQPGKTFTPGWASASGGPSRRVSTKAKSSGLRFSSCPSVPRVLASAPRCAGRSAFRYSCSAAYLGTSKYAAIHLVGITLVQDALHHPDLLDR